MTPLAIDLYCGLGGWTEGLLAEGYRVVGFDLERHDYGTGGYPAQLVLQDVLTLHGAQFKDAALIVASPPCQAYSFMAMPWSRAKQLARDYETGVRDRAELTALFDACFRIQREASEAAGHHIPLVVENVRGAQPWVGRAKWRFGSFYLWGDVPALMPIPRRRDSTKNDGGSWFNIAHNTASGHGQNPDGRLDGVKVPGMSWSDRSRLAQAFNGEADRRLREGEKIGGLKQQRDGHGHTRHLTNQLEHEGIKQRGSGREWFAGDGKISRTTSSKSNARKRAAAEIARIPLPLSRHIARAWYPPDLT